MMADLIDRAVMIHRLCAERDEVQIEHACDVGYHNGLNMAVSMTINAPAVDAVEVVRCKDCKHWLKDFAGCTDAVGRCEWANYMVGANGYCVYGERKDNG
ncbi:MAG: hypothetical protein IKV47_06710 [Oscillospiraceae bacterium]|nr:hypothetical protein [Oscillospiraceae bacterium]